MTICSHQTLLMIHTDCPRIVHILVHTHGLVLRFIQVVVVNINYTFLEPTDELIISVEPFFFFEESHAAHFIDYQTKLHCSPMFEK
jgi:hypothetical protein